MASKPDNLQRYREKRHFDATPEPDGSAPRTTARAGGTRSEAARSFVIQKHWATRLHYDFRLELDGTLKSWAVPKGPSYDPADKRMAVQVEDHPLSYGGFEGTIPEGNYGAGKVIVWDRGTWHPLGDPVAGYRDGKLKFELRGEKLHGHWTLVRIRAGGHGKKDERQPPWLLIKEHDGRERPAAEYSVVEARPDSVLSGIAAEPDRVRTKPGSKQKVPVASTPPAPPAIESEASRPPEGARKAAMPATLAPQLATLTDAAPTDADGWFYELKYDGYRILARLDHGQVQLFTRAGNDWTAKMPALVRAIAALPFEQLWLDGEIVVPRDDGVPDFQALQNAFDRKGSRSAAASLGGRMRQDHADDRLVYYVFDIPYCNGHDLQDVPQDARRAVLERVLDHTPAASADRVRLSAALDVPAAQLVPSACRLGFEGVIGKRRDAPYTGRRSAAWIKLKCSQRQEFVIVGWTDPQGTRTGLGALLLAVHDVGGKLRYAGNVGTGFNGESLAALRARLDPLATDAAPLADASGVANKHRVHWVQPVLMAEVAFAEWTDEGRVRHAVFQGLRDDKAPRAITQDKPVPIAKVEAKAATRRKTATPGRQAAPAEAHDAPGLPAGFRITHPERVIDKASGTTKLQLVQHHARAAGVMLPHLRARPLALVRVPGGVGAPQFFQKHGDENELPGVTQVPASTHPLLDADDGAILSIDRAEGLLAVAQMNAIELHTWNATTRRLGEPDRMTFDLDPGEGVGWPAMQQAAQLVQAFLAELGLPCFLKTSGGKGLHVVVPIKPQHGWDAVKGFSQAVVQHLARTLPERFVAKSGPKNRVGKIFIDYLRNGFGATTVCAWSARARPGLGVSVPVAWDELPALTGGAHWTVATVPARIASHGNTPWDGYEKAGKPIGPAAKALGYTLPTD